MRKFLPIPAALIGVAAGVEPDQPPADSEWYAHGITNAWLQSYDPTLVSRRLHNEFNYQNFDAGSSQYEIDTTFRGAYPMAKDIAFGYQFEQTYKWLNTGTGTVSGTGDFQFRPGVVARISPTVRFGTGVNMTFDTASDPALGNNAFLLRPILGIRWDATPVLNVGTNVEYTFTPTDEGSNDASELELKFPVALKFSEQWSGSATYKPQWNFLSDDSRQRLELDLGYVWGKDNQFALTAGVEIPLTTQNLQFKSIVSFDWYF